MLINQGTQVQPSYSGSRSRINGEAKERMPRVRVLCVANAAGYGWCRLVRDSLAEVGPVDLANEVDAPARVAAGHYDAVILDASHVSDVLGLVTEMRRRDAGARVLVASAAPTWRQARDAYNAGAYRYLVKSPDMSDLRTILIDEL